MSVNFQEDSRVACFWCDLWLIVCILKNYCYLCLMGLELRVINRSCDKEVYAIAKVGY